MAQIIHISSISYSMNRSIDELCHNLLVCYLHHDDNDQWSLEPLANQYYNKVINIIISFSIYRSVVGILSVC